MKKNLTTFSSQIFHQKKKEEKRSRFGLILLNKHRISLTNYMIMFIYLSISRWLSRGCLIK